MPNALYDAQHIRYQLVSSHEGKPYNWLFIPGGPGSDSGYFKGLIELLELPGNCWLVDLPGNGTNIKGIPEDYDYNKWFDLFVPMVKGFDNAIVVGQSWGGMFPLAFPELEDCLTGFVILNSAPGLWMGEAENYSKKFKLPDLTKEMHAFTTNPNQQTFETALNACMPYYFSEESMERGRALFAGCAIQYKAAVWWQHKAVEMNFDAKWIPQKVPTLIIAGTRDCITPYVLFEQDERFKRPNIDLKVIQGAGHCSWLEQPKVVKEAFKNFVKKLSPSALYKKND